MTDPVRTGLMRRLVKEQLVHADGSRLFPGRRASTVGYRLSAIEHDLYEEVSEYVRHEMNKVSKTGRDTTNGGLRAAGVAKAASFIPRGDPSLVAAPSDKLSNEMERMHAADQRLAMSLEANLGLRPPEDLDDLLAADAERWEDEASAVATTARTVGELEVEVRTSKDWSRRLKPSGRQTSTQSGRRCPASCAVLRCMTKRRVSGARSSSSPSTATPLTTWRTSSRC